MFHLFTKDSQYVTTVKYYKPKYTVGKSHDEMTESDVEVVNVIHEIIEKCQKTEYMNKVTEIIFLHIVDHGDLKFQIHIKGKEVVVKTQWDQSVFSTITISIYRYNLENFNRYMDDGNLTNEELHRTIHVLAAPAIESFYHSEMVNKLHNPGILKLDKLLHLELKNPNGYEYMGVPMDGKVTVMNVLGQFIVLRGHIGVAPVKFECDVPQALEYYNLLKYKLPAAKTLIEKKNLFQEYMNLRARTVVQNPEYHHLDN